MSDSESLETMRKLLEEIVDAAYSTLCESNGISDNEWKTEDGVCIPEYPVGSFVAALVKLEKAWSAADDYLKASRIVPVK